MPRWRGPESGSAPRSPSDRPERDAAELLVDAVRVLHVNGAETERTEARTRQIASALGFRAEAQLGWCGSAVIIRSGSAAPQIWPFSAAPAGLGANRVFAVDRVADDLASGRSTAATAARQLREAEILPASNIGLFAAACAFGACALAVILGAQHPGTFVVIAISAALGAVCRRALGSLGANNFWQVAVAGVLAGIGGAASTALGTSSPLGLAAVCPCMVLVPGPHLIKGALDLGSLRISLGIDRLLFATITLVAIGSGLLIGLGVGHADLVADPPSRLVPIWLDAPAAGLVAVCYGIFYSAPLRLIRWPFAVGMAAHALRWIALEIWHLESWVGAGLACLLVGAVLYPVGLRRSIPFSAIGFAAVVSLMPGVLVFRALGGLVHLQTVTAAGAPALLLRAVDDLTGAALTVVAMAVGFLIPSATWRRLMPNEPRGAALEASG